MADRNKVELSGLAISEPTLTRMAGSRTQVTTFLLQVNEEYFTDGRKTYHPNVIVVESLGKQADVVLDRVKKGARYEVTGYLRADSNKFSIRTFAVTKESKDDNLSFYNGIEAALEAVMSSRDKDSAIEEIRRILADA